MPRGLFEAIGFAALVLAVATPAAARGPIYSFVDADGVAHFTDAPIDPRYAPLYDRRPKSRRGRRIPARWDFDGLIRLSAREHRLPPALVKAVIAAESNFEPTATSRRGAQGLMQLMPETARSLGVEDPFEPSENVRGGSRYLRRLMDRYGDLQRTLAAYNAGPSVVDRHGGMPPYRETRDYVQRVLTYYRYYHGDFGQ
ncbi:lytic transglycosylase domain-containing protein [bacterium]|nr:lytic transglycosylase domain-containing protein [bacterium]